MKSFYRFQRPPSILASGTAAGRREFKGPLGGKFDLHDDTDAFGMTTWEQSEAESQRLALNLALAKCHRTPDCLDALFAGDLINQCTSSAFGLLNFHAPFFGLYGACSTIVEGLILASILFDAGHIDCAAAVTSSHFCSAERQFRSPLEYGGQRPPTAQWTATGAGAYLLGQGDGPCITAALPGIVIDGGVTDSGNMGAAMAPAAANTLTRWFGMTGRRPSDYDRIVTGDLGNEGHTLLYQLCAKAGLKLPNLGDCGLMLYDRNADDVHAGASGCGCAALVLAAKLLEELKTAPTGRILLIGTGALMSPLSVMQGLSIPGVAHLIEISRDGHDGPDMPDTPAVSDRPDREEI